MKSLSLSKPHVLVMVGIPGSGKSFFAEHFAETFNAPLISFEQLRRKLFIESTYTAEQQAAVGRVGNHMQTELLKTKTTVIIDGAADSRTDRQEVARQARSAGFEPLFIWVQTDLATAKQRSIKPVKGTQKLTSDQFNSALKRFSAPHAIEKTVVISGKHTYASQVKIVLKRLVEPRAETTKIQPPPARTVERRTIAVR